MENHLTRLQVYIIYMVQGNWTYNVLINMTYVLQDTLSMVRLKNCTIKIRGRTCATSRSREKKLSATRKVSLSFNNRHTLGSYRGLNQSEIVKGGPPPLIGRGPDIPVRVCMFDASAAAVRQRERER